MTGQSVRDCQYCKKCGGYHPSSFRCLRITGHSWEKVLALKRVRRYVRRCIIRALRLEGVLMRLVD